MPSNTHHIKKINLKASIPSTMDSFAFQQELNAFFYEKMQQIVEKYLDQYSNAEEIIQLDKLNLQLHLPQIRQWKKNCLAELKVALEKALEEQILQQANQLIRHPIGTNKFRAWLDFLENGTIRWQVAQMPEVDLQQHILDTIAGEIWAVRQFRNLLTRNGRAFKRLIWQHKPEFLTTLLTALTGRKQTDLVNFGLVLQEAWRPAGSPYLIHPPGYSSMPISAFQKQFWGLIWKEILANPLLQEAEDIAKGVVKQWLSPSEIRTQLSTIKKIKIKQTSKALAIKIFEKLAKETTSTTDIIASKTTTLMGEDKFSISPKRKKEAISKRSIESQVESRKKQSDISEQLDSSSTILNAPRKQAISADQKASDISQKKVEASKPAFNETNNIRTQASTENSKESKAYQIDDASTPTEKTTQAALKDSAQKQGIIKEVGFDKKDNTPKKIEERLIFNTKDSLAKKAIQTINERESTKKEAAKPTADKKTATNNQLNPNIISETNPSLVSIRKEKDRRKNREETLSTKSSKEVAKSIDELESDQNPNLEESKTVNKSNIEKGTVSSDSIEPNDENNTNLLISNIQEELKATNEIEENRNATSIFSENSKTIDIDADRGKKSSDERNTNLPISNIQEELKATNEIEENKNATSVFSENSKTIDIDANRGKKSSDERNTNLQSLETQEELKATDSIEENKNATSIFSENPKTIDIDANRDKKSSDERNTNLQSLETQEELKATDGIGENKNATSVFSKNSKTTDVDASLEKESQAPSLKEPAEGKVANSQSSKKQAELPKIDELIQEKTPALSKDDTLINKNQKEMPIIFPKVENSYPWKIEPPKIGASYYLNYAGLVLLHPFIPHLLKEFKLLHQKEFTSEANQHKAVLLLQYLADKVTDIPEYQLLMPKLLCGMPFDQPLDRHIQLTKKEMEETDSLLIAAIKHWGALGNSSPDALRAGFLKREGKLEKKEQGWSLKIEQKTMDILLDRLPWGLSMVKLPCMKEILYVEWR